MESIKGASHRIVYAAVGLFVVLAVGLGLSSLGASAAQVEERSVQLSNSSKSATNVNYRVTFTPAEEASAFVLEFCANTPIIGQECTAPAGFNASEAVVSATTPTPGFTVNSKTANRVVVANDLVGGTPAVVDIEGFVNPTAAGAMYVRIVTFDSVENAGSSTSTNLAGSVDQGGAAVSITDTIGVSGTVLESLTFCASQQAINDQCETTVAPTLRLGEQVGDTVALQPGVLSEGNMFVQLSTNAVGGAVVRLKSTAINCGGLVRVGAEAGECHILPALDTGINVANNDAKFGVRTAAATDTTGMSNATGSLAPVEGSNYNNEAFALNFAEGNMTGITSTFGDPFLDTAGAPASHKNMQLTFGASINNNTPAGTYSTDISLIAVGTF